jgi:hypothetical protein
VTKYLQFDIYVAGLDTAPAHPPHPTRTEPPRNARKRPNRHLQVTISGRLRRASRPAARGGRWPHRMAGGRDALNVEAPVNVSSRASTRTFSSCFRPSRAVNGALPASGRPSCSPSASTAYRAGGHAAAPGALALVPKARSPVQPRTVHRYIAA